MAPHHPGSTAVSENSLVLCAAPLYCSMGICWGGGGPDPLPWGPSCTLFLNLLALGGSVLLETEARKTLWRGRTCPGRKRNGRIYSEKIQTNSSELALPQLCLSNDDHLTFIYRNRPSQKPPSIRRDTFWWGVDLDASLCSDRWLPPDLPVPKWLSEGTGHSLSFCLAPCLHSLCVEALTAQSTRCLAG